MTSFIWPQMYVCERTYVRSLRVISLNTVQRNTPVLCAGIRIRKRNFDTGLTSHEI